MAQFLGIGDLHLTDSSGSGGLSKYIDNHDEMVINEMSKVLEYGRKQGITHVILYGDISDSPRLSYQAMVALFHFFTRNEEFQFHIILGNHDMYGEVPELGHSLEILQLLYNRSNVHFYTKPKTIRLDGTKVRFLPYPHESFDKEALNVFHKEVYGCKNDSGRQYLDEKLTKSKSVVCAGHIHTAHRIRNTFYSGTLYQTNFGESLPKYFHHIEFNSNKDYEINLIRHNPTYKLHTIVIESRNDLKLIPEKNTDLVKLIIQDSADISTIDYSKRNNIVQIKPFRNKEELAAVLTEDIIKGEQIVVKVEDFFRDWLESLDVDDNLREHIKSVRKRILTTV